MWQMPGHFVLRFMGSQRVGTTERLTELNEGGAVYSVL